LNIPDNCNVDEEKICNRFASALLMPKTAMISEFGEGRNILNYFEIDAVKKEYKVSPQAIAYRLKDLAIISDNLYKNLCMYMSKNIGKNDPDPIPPEESFQFKKLICKLEASKIISVQKASDLMGVSVNEYNRLYNSNRY
jgi:Zn-dependent peptidase ImmA (M78 family)